MEVFERDCLVYLGTCVAAKGTGKAARTCFEYSIEGETTTESGEMTFGEIKLLPLALGETAQCTVQPARGFDVGAGPGRQVRCTVRGGTVGLILDARGRPLELPDDRLPCRETIERWITALDLYPSRTAVPA